MTDDDILNELDSQHRRQPLGGQPGIRAGEVVPELHRRHAVIIRLGAL
jgi:hypothetical protein